MLKLNIIVKWMHQQHRLQLFQLRVCPPRERRERENSNEDLIALCLQLRTCVLASPRGRRWWGSQMKIASVPLCPDEIYMREWAVEGAAEKPKWCKKATIWFNSFLLAWPRCSAQKCRAKMPLLSGLWRGENIAIWPETIKLIEIKYSWKNNSIIGIFVGGSGPINRRALTRRGRRRNFMQKAKCASILFWFFSSLRGQDLALSSHHFTEPASDSQWHLGERAKLSAAPRYRYQNIFNLFN